MKFIPKNIHQNFLSAHSLIPKNFIDWSQSIQKLNPEYNYKLWSNEELEQEFPDLYSSNFFMQCSTHAERSCIITLYILYKYGGIYMDLDCESYKPFGDYFCNKSFSVAFCDIPQSHMIASAPNHPYLKKLIEALEERFLTHGSTTSEYKYGPHFLKDYLMNDLKPFEKMPSELFVPYNYFEKDSIDIKDVPKLFPNAICAHHWAGSWI